MIASGLIAIAIFAQQTAAPPTPPAPQTGAVSADSGEIFARRSSSPDMAELHAEVLARAPDPSWSPGMEAELIERHQRIPAFGNAIQSFSVTCADTLCEAVGTTRPGLSNEETTSLMGALQAIGPQPGLDQVVHGFTTAKDDPASLVFASFWRRRD